MGKIRGTHSSPGIYTQITDIEYTTKTLGITTAGLVGETLQGPAFEPIMVKDFSEFRSVFGGTSAERFKDSLYPKYELPYIAKSYLSKSDQLYVCRVLGLSGYNAGPAYIITASGEDEKKYVIAVLRLRGTYNKVGGADECNNISNYDTINFSEFDEIKIEPSNSFSITSSCAQSSIVENISLSGLDMGHFTIKTKKQSKDGSEESNAYNVSLNPGDKDYIYKVLGGAPNDGTTELFVEELYDLYLENLIEEGKVDKIDSEVITFQADNLENVYEPVSDVFNPDLRLTSNYIGKTYLSLDSYAYTVYTVSGTTYNAQTATIEGGVYKVSKINDPNTGKKVIGYVEEEVTWGGKIGDTDKPISVVKVLSQDVLYAKNENNNIVPYTSFSDYKEQFRQAMTPWFVSQATINTSFIDMKRLFRFHTITDGNNANSLIKISISNILPDEGTFDVLIRDFYDTDASPIILESYKGVNLLKGSDKYLGLKVGDGEEFALKSKYVMVEINEDSVIEGMVPCGFLGYPIRSYGDLVKPQFMYNTIYNKNIRDKKQYFGLSDITGIDVDMLNYKGKTTYYEYNGEVPDVFTNAFHLDSYVNSEFLAEKLPENGYTDIKYMIDGVEQSNLKWTTVSPQNTTDTGKSPVISTESEMEGTIYENIKLRKFTCYPYGGFDGWDIYRGARTTGDEFKANNYKGRVGYYGETFAPISDDVTLNLSGRAITSDYYAFLAGAKQFEDPERHIINLFATPGIDYVNNKELSTEILEMIEEKRFDSLYVMTTPDKPYGASDSVDEMFTADDVVANLEDSDIDSYYATTYYPWVKYFDKENNLYINLPATKDVLRNMADVDNKKYPWYAPAGIERGNVECHKMHFFAKLEDEDTVYDGYINPLKTFSRDGVKIWGNKTMYTGNTPMNRVNVVRLMLYMRKLIIESVRGLIFEPNDTTLKSEFESIVNPILAQIKKDRGITDFRLEVSQTPEQMDAHELSAVLYVKPTPTLEYIEINFVVTPQGVSFDSL
jgi:hypothetical protein